MIEPDKQVARFVLAGARVVITFEVRPQNAADGRTIDLKPLSADDVELSFTGECAGHMGQCDSTIAEQLARAKDAPGAEDVAAILDYWDRWHLNGLRPGTRRQMDALKGADLGPNDGDLYTRQCAYLDKLGLLVDDQTDPAHPYKFGAGWLFEPPAGQDGEDVRAVVADVRARLSRLDGARIGVSEEVASAEEAGDPLDAPEFGPDSDVIDSRDVVARIEALKDYLRDLPEDERTPERYDPETDSHGDRSDEVDELARLLALESQAGSCGDWGFGATLIAESYFEEYAEQFAEDIGAVNREAAWPNNHIDWSAAAEELKQDYTSVDFAGRLFWVR